MDTPCFDRWARSVSAVLPRRTLAAALGLGTLLLASPSEAKNKRKKKKKGDVNKLCKGEASTCVATLTAQCDEDPACLEVVQLCCLELATCNTFGFLTCLQENLA